MGIGFLGAGTIIRHEGGIIGLTTVASIWVVAGVGLAIGGGLYILALVTAAMTFLALRLPRRKRKQDEEE